MFGGGGYCFGGGGAAAARFAGGTGGATGEVVIRISSSNGSTNISIQIPQQPQTFETVAPPSQGFHFGDGGLNMPPQGFQFGGTVPQDIFNFMQQQQQRQTEDRILCPQCGKSMEDGHFHKEEDGNEEKK